MSYIRGINIISIERLLHFLLSGKLFRFRSTSFFNICRSHGLSYTKFALSDLQLSEAVVSNGEFRLGVSLIVENIGAVTGSEIIQVYISLPETIQVKTPKLQLKGFTKVRDLAPGNKEHVTVVLDKYAVSYWDVRIKGWTVEKGVYRVEVGTGSDRLSLEETFEVTKGFNWNGL